MASITTLQKSICLDAKEIGPNILRTIVQHVRRSHENTCDEKEGVILGIHRIDRVENVISKDARYVHVTVTFLADVVKPEKGLTVEFQPTLIIQKGIFGKIWNSVNLFIPESYMNGWVYKSDRFVHPTGKEVTRDTMVSATITDIKFAVTKYNCICEMSRSL